MPPTPSTVPQVSVITRTKDRAVLLERALNSIANQRARNFQVVVVNDGGAPGHVDDLTSVLRKTRPDLDLVVIHNPESHGRGGALVDGLDHATGAVYAVLDDDDTWEPGFLTTTVGHLDAHPGDVAVATRTWVIWEDLVGSKFVEARREILDAEMTAVTLLRTARRNSVPTNALVIRREVAQRVGGYDPSLATMEDWDLLLRLLGDGHVGYILGEPQAHYRLRQSADGPLGNSVYLEEDGHRNSALQLRDAYARAGGVTGEVMMSAEYANELEARIESLHQRFSSFELAQSAHLEAVFDALGRERLIAQVDRLQSGLGALTEQLQQEHQRRGFWRRVSARLSRKSPSAPPAAAAPDTDATPIVQANEEPAPVTIRTERQVRSAPGPSAEADPWNSNRWLDLTESGEK